MLGQWFLCNSCDQFCLYGVVSCFLCSPNHIPQFDSRTQPNAEQTTVVVQLWKLRLVTPHSRTGPTSPANLIHHPRWPSQHSISKGNIPIQPTSDKTRTRNANQFTIHGMILQKRTSPNLNWYPSGKCKTILQPPHVVFSKSPMFWMVSMVNGSTLRELGSSSYKLDV